MFGAAVGTGINLCRPWLVMPLGAALWTESTLGELEEVVGAFSPFTAAKATPEPVEGGLECPAVVPADSIRQHLSSTDGHTGHRQAKLPLSRCPKLPSPL
jgi:hypothetical protein